MKVSSIKHLYAFQDGDTITPGMGVSIDAGFGLQQYYNPTTKEVIATDFRQHPAVLYPQAYSSKMGEIIVPESVGQQWYYNNMSSEGAILEDGVVKEKWRSLFEVTTVSQNGKVYPALKIKGNLVTATDWTDKYIYYSSSYNGSTFTCQQVIPAKAYVGKSYDVLVSFHGADGAGDNVLSADNDWVEVTAALQEAGITVVSGVTYKFQKLTGSMWTDAATIPGVMEVNGNVIKFYEAAVDGIEVFRAVATMGGTEYYETFEVTDVHDPYIIDDGCSHPSGAMRKGETVSFDPKVYERSSGRESTGWSFAYEFVAAADGKVCTDLTSRNLTFDNISRYGGIAVKIEATKA